MVPMAMVLLAGRVLVTGSHRARSSVSIHYSPMISSAVSPKETQDLGKHGIIKQTR